MFQYLLQTKWLGFWGGVFFVVCYSALSFSTEFQDFDQMLPRVEYELGQVEVEAAVFNLTVMNLPGIRFGDDSFYVIHFKQNRNKVGEITFIRESERLLFQGIIINKAMRNKGLSRPFLKTFFSLGLSLGYKSATTKNQRKPLVNLQLQKFGFTPDSRKHSCQIDTAVHEDQKLHVYPVGCSFKNKLIISQNLQILSNPPLQSTSVPVLTSFSQPVNDDDFASTLQLMPGIPKFVDSVNQKF